MNEGQRWVHLTLFVQGYFRVASCSLGSGYCTGKAASLQGTTGLMPKHVPGSSVQIVVLLPSKNVPNASLKFKK